MTISLTPLQYCQVGPHVPVRTATRVPLGPPLRICKCRSITQSGSNSEETLE
jgi:hypothetical protein